MQQCQEENWANQMGSIPASDVSSNPNWGFGGAEAELDNSMGAQPWSTLSLDFNIGTFPDLSGSIVVKQTPLGLPPTLQQLLPLWSEENIIGGQPGPASFVAGDGYSYPEALLLEENILGQPWPAASVSDFDVGAFPDPSGSVEIQQAPLGIRPAPQQPPPLPRFPCAQPGCTESFPRDYERTRHQNTVHSARQGLYLCPVPGCPKSHGAGYSRADKVTEHLWKKHADLGYAKRVL